jgi:hypothetical protein
MMPHPCTTCGYPHAAFGRKDHKGNRTWFCGWRNGEPVCVGRGR